MLSYLFRGLSAPRRSLVLDVNGDSVISGGVVLLAHLGSATVLGANSLENLV